MVELTYSLGVLFHQAPQLTADCIGKIAGELNQIFESNDSAVSVRPLRAGDAIDPEFMDGTELQGQRPIDEVKAWAMMASERIGRKAVITGK